jgi:hypothetical protein
VSEPYPVRIQRKRTKGFNLQAASPNGLPVVYVGRPSKWGNPYVAETDAERANAVELFRQWVYDLIERGVYHDINELRGKNLACWCKEGEECHADILLYLANWEPE